MRSRAGGWLIVLLLPMTVGAADRLSTEQRLERLERRVGTVSELTLRLDAVQRENRQLRGEVETLQYQIDQLKRKQRDIYLDIDQRLSGMGSSSADTALGQAPPAVTGGVAAPVPTAVDGPAPVRPAPVVDRAPAAVVEREPARPAPAQAAGGPVVAYDNQKMQADYKSAYALLSPSQRRYDDAAKAFSAFLADYPNSPLAANAQYWLAESYYVSQKNDQALAAFNKVVSDYPTSPKVAGALYKIGRLENVKGNRSAARKTLERVIAEYPSSPAAGLAKDLLAKIK